tara:strand:- start:1489 stop:2532 length:1044 start_codon:yes stop_codon:yes gene_type:complete
MEPLHLGAPAITIGSPDSGPTTPKAKIWRQLVKNTSPDKNPQLLGGKDTQLTTERLDLSPVFPRLAAQSYDDYQETLNIVREKTSFQLQEVLTEYAQEFKPKLGLVWPNARADLSTVPMILDSIPYRALRYDKGISLGLSTRWYDAIEPLLKGLEWVDISQPLREHSLTEREIEHAQRAMGVLLLNPQHVTTERLLHILQVVAPLKIQKKYKRLVDATQRIEALQGKKKMLDEKISFAEAEHQEKKTTKPAKPADNKKASGFRSRVGSLLRKRKKRGRSAKKGKPRKPRKPRQKKVKKVEVEKQEPVMEPKKPVEIPASPRIKQKKAGAIHDFPVFVRKKRTKKYLQ